MLKRLAMVAACIVSPTVHAANLLTNGSFETPVIGYPYAFYSSGSTAITGWTAVGPGETQNTRTEFLPASDGAQWIDLTGYSGYDKGLRSDAVVTEVGATYRLSFDLGDYQPFGSSTVSVRVNDGAPTLFVNPYQSGIMDWERKSLSWVADATSARITFLGVANGALSNDLGIGLDNVVFEKLPPPAVPEPGTCALMVAGLGLIGAAARRRVR
ncbi:MAG: PEPxxWA-CTERM sorting domain-containing protein [Burkholderiales bacterium]